MAVDLKLSGWTRRQSLIIDSECLIQLEAEATQDRVRRIYYDRLESIVVRREVPWISIQVLAVMPGLPGLALLFLEPSPALPIFGSILLGLSLLISLAHLYCRRTTLWIQEDGNLWEISGIAAPRKPRRFLERLRLRVEEAQAEARARAQARQAELPEPDNVRDAPGASAPAAEAPVAPPAPPDGAV